MNSRNAIFVFLLALLLLVSVVAYAQDADDDDVDDDADGEFSAELNFETPEVLEGEETYDFEFAVENTTTPGDYDRWIVALEMYMPSQDYDIEDVAAPDAIHDGEWISSFIEDDGYQGIRWEYSWAATSEGYGDIPEGETLGFAFRATTDSNASDGFPWAVWGDDGSLYTGKSCVLPENCGEPDDDDDDGDDDTEDDGDDDWDDDTDDDTEDDEDDSAGDCGC